MSFRARHISDICTLTGLPGPVISNTNCSDVKGIRRNSLVPLHVAAGLYLTASSYLASKRTPSSGRM